MPQKPHRIGSIPATPLSRHGLVTLRELRAEGLSYNAIHQRVKRGALFRRYHGVYSLSGGALSREGEWTAALLAAGEGATLGRFSAAVLAQAWRYREDAIDVLLPRRHVAIPGVRLIECRTLDPLDVYVHRGIRVTTMARTLVDLSDELIAEELANVIHEAAYRGCFDPPATRRAMERANGRRNLDVLDDALTQYERGSAGTRSRAEVAFVKAWGRTDRPVVNTRVEGIEVDLHWPADRLVVELDGPGHRRGPTRREDALKQRILESAGWTVLRIPSAEAESQPERVTTRVREYLG